MREGHWSPFEMASMCLEIQTTRDIARQIIRHRSFSFQEFSQRYAEVEHAPDYREARGQDLKNRQNSVRLPDGALHEDWRAYQQKVYEITNAAYTWALNNGIAKEQARAVLPEGMTISTLYMNGTIRSWIHYAELRGGHGTQHEHILIAQEVSKILDEHVWTE
jgi:thymidylate synthase (FAD)